MLKNLKISQFKGFQEFDVEFNRLNLLVGANNSGKTSIFHALQLFFWAFDNVAQTDGESVRLAKTQTSAIPIVPHDAIRDLFFRQKVRAGGQPNHIKLSLSTTTCDDVEIDIYPAYGRNYMVSGQDRRITKSAYEQMLTLAPVFVPSTVGITPHEDYYRPISLRSMIHQGRHNQVLRNMVFEISKSEDWSEFIDLIKPIFQLESISVPFETERDLWIKAIYKEGDCAFDFISAGSGFLQVVNLLTFLFHSPTKVALLDEPDSHLHEDLLRLTFELLDRLSERKGLQLLIATHSPVLIDSASFDQILLIDRKESHPIRTSEANELIPILTSFGIALPTSKIMDALRSRRVVFVEGEESDYTDFLEAFGRLIHPEFKTRTRGLVVFEIGEGRKDWPFDAIEAFNRLIGGNLDYRYICDRDFLLPEEVAKRETRSEKIDKEIKHLQRRNRECYLINPKVLSRLLISKWKKRSPEALPPQALLEQDIHNWFVAYSREKKNNTRTTLLVEKESYFKGDQNHRTSKIAEVNEYFENVYVSVLERDEIPFVLLDGKQALREFRKFIATGESKVHFNDLEIISSFGPSEIPTDIVEIIESIISMFPNQESSLPNGEIFDHQINLPSDSMEQPPLFE